MRIYFQCTNRRHAGANYKAKKYNTIKNRLSCRCYKHNQIINPPGGIVIIEYNHVNNHQPNINKKQLDEKNVYSNNQGNICTYILFFLLLVLFSTSK